MYAFISKARFVPDWGKELGGSFAARRVAQLGSSAGRKRWHAKFQASRVQTPTAVVSFEIAAALSQVRAYAITPGSCHVGGSMVAVVPPPSPNCSPNAGEEVSIYFEADPFPL